MPGRLTGYSVYAVKAFSLNGAGGNMAGVVIPGDGHIRSGLFSADLKKSVAAVLGFSETVFPYSSTKADFRLEYFTPAGEVPVCGHATIAFFVTLRELGMLEKDKYLIETGAGILEVRAEGGRIFMQQNSPDYGEHVSRDELSSCFRGIVFHKELLPQIVSTGLRDIILPLGSVDCLSSMEPDFEQIKAVSRKYDCVGIHAFAIPEKSHATADAHTAICRNFAPLYDIDEESATGTSNCALACYLYKNGLRLRQYRFGQGYSLSQPSEILVDLMPCVNAGKDRANDGFSVWAGGDGYIFRRIV